MKNDQQQDEQRSITTSSSSVNGIQQITAEKRTEHQNKEEDSSMMTISTTSGTSASSQSEISALLDGSSILECSNYNNSQRLSPGTQSSSSGEQQELNDDKEAKISSTGQSCASTIISTVVDHVDRAQQQRQTTEDQDRKSSFSSAALDNVNSQNDASLAHNPPRSASVAFAQRRARKLQECLTADMDTSSASAATRNRSSITQPQPNDEQLGVSDDMGTTAGEVRPPSTSTVAQMPPGRARRRSRKSLSPTPPRRSLTAVQGRPRRSLILPNESAHRSIGSSSIHTRNRESSDTFHVNSDVLLEPSSDCVPLDVTADAIANSSILRESVTSVGRRFSGRTQTSLDDEDSSVLSFAASYTPNLPTMDEANIPSDQPGAFPARGRAFGDFPSWGRGPGGETLEASISRQPSITGWIRNGITRSIRRMGDGQGTVRSSAFGYSTADSDIIEASLVDTEHDVVYPSDVVSDDSTKQLRQQYCRIFVALGLIIIGLVVGLSFLIVKTGGDSNGNSDGLDQDYQGDPQCLLTNEEKDVFGHCLCYDATDALVLSIAEKEQYLQMRQLLFDENVINEMYDRSSCDPSNQALLWMANYERVGLLPSEIELATPLNIIQRFVVAYIYITMNGENWKDSQGWMREKYPCDWSGLTCSFFKRISEIDLSGQGLEGTLPTQLGMMPFLRVLDLSHNPGIYGPLPNELVSNPSLHEIDVSNNQLSGSLPMPLVDSAVLDRLILTNNNFSGVVPSEIGRFLRLRQISFDHNKIHGSLPEEIGLLSNLEVLELNANEMTGTIPDSLQSLVFLEHIEIDSNFFSGTIPDFVGSNFPNLETLFVYENEFSGTVPETFCNEEGRQELSTVIATCTGNFSVVPSCSCCKALVYCFELLPPSLQDSV